MTEALHLTTTDLYALTGYRQPARQCAWLTSRGWVYEPPGRRGDHPKVSRAYHDARMSGQRPQSERQRPRSRPDGLPPNVYERFGSRVYSIGYKARDGCWKFRLSCPVGDRAKIAALRLAAQAQAAE